MESLSQFFAMGGYAQFVWPAFGISALVLTGLFIHSRIFLSRAEAELAALQAADAIVLSSSGSGSELETGTAP